MGKENVSRADKAKEAIKRMRKLRLFDQVIDEFEESGTIEYSEPTRINAYRFGALYWVSNEPEWLEMISAFEENENAIVYHAVHSYTDFGEMLSLLYVSDYPEEWEYENENIDDGIVMTYTINFDDPISSEFGCIGIESASGGLLRKF